MKKWRVKLSDYDGYKTVDADELIVNGGALVFVVGEVGRGSRVELVIGPYGYEEVYPIGELTER